MRRMVPATVAVMGTGEVEEGVFGVKVPWPLLIS